LKLNTIGKTINQLRIFIKDRVRRKIIPPLDLSDYKVPSEDSDTIYLTRDEIEKIYYADLSQFPYLCEYRDLFVLACMTGLRFSDFSTLHPEDVRNNMLYKKQEKTDTPVVIPLRPLARIAFMRQFGSTCPAVSNPEFNRHIKRIGEIAGICQPVTFISKKGAENVVVTKPKFEWITTHTARRSFCTNELLSGTPVSLIMRISGHKKESSFYRYVKISPEEAALRIEELWRERNEMEFISMRPAAVAV
jgi:integrase